MAWLDKHPRFHLHFIPTSSSWLNMVERSFRELTEKAIRRGVFKSVPDLIAAIEAYLQANNNDPKPFVWTAMAEEILEKVGRGRVALASTPANQEAPHWISEGSARPTWHSTWFSVWYLLDRDPAQRRSIANCPTW